MRLLSPGRVSATTARAAGSATAAKQASAWVRGWPAPCAPHLPPSRAQLPYADAPCTGSAGSVSLRATQVVEMNVTLLLGAIELIRRVVPLMYVCMYVCMYVRTQVGMNLCMYVRMMDEWSYLCNVCMNACMLCHAM